VNTENAPEPEITPKFHADPVKRFVTVLIFLFHAVNLVIVSIAVVVNIAVDSIFAFRNRTKYSTSLLFLYIAVTHKLTGRP
jgi:hypothetical protein